MSFFAMRKGERRDVWAAFLTLFSLIASHAMLETARDALFLAKISAARLPWVFLAVAALSLGSLKLDAQVTRGLSSRRALSVVTFGSSAVTLAFFAFHRQLGVRGLYALYVWSGLLATLLLGHFWELVGDRFTITQAKRLYGFIGAGSVLGAIAGSGCASVLARVMPAEHLVLVSALGLAVAGLVPLLFANREAPLPVLEQAPKLRETFGYVARDAYARRVVAALFLATVCLTLSDFVFKSAIAALVPKANLGAFLGTVYFAVNVLSLLCQVGLVAWILRRVSLGAALGILPALLVVSGLGVAISASLVAVLALKASDGSLRYSLHRTTAELLVLPFGDDGRRRVKSFVDLVGQRASQVVASLTILGFAALGAPPRLLALALVLLACVWFAFALSLRGPYVAVFRARLKAGRSTQLEQFPELDLSSLETLLAAFESPNDREVLAALSLLERENKTQLVPALLLHHPSEQVVLRVLDILTRSGRTSAVPTIDRILDRARPGVRAAALAARSVLAPDAEQLRERLALEESAEVRTTIAVNLLVSGGSRLAERERQLEDLLHNGTLAAKLSFAEAVARRAASGFDRALVALLAAAETEVRCASVRAMGRVASPGLLPHLVSALADEATRADAEHSLAGYGGDAFEALLERFQDPTTEFALRWRIPPAMASCSPELTLPALVSWLPREPDGGVRFGILLVLERLVRQHPTLSLDRSALRLSVRDTLTRCYRYLDARLQLSRGALQHPARKTAGHQLLCDLLRDKELNARGRLFRLLGLLHPTEDFVHIYRSLGVSKDLRASSVELIESILREPVRSAVLGLIDDEPEAQRLVHAGRYFRPRQVGYAALLERLCINEGDAVRQVARFHAAELGLSLSEKQAEQAA